MAFDYDITKVLSVGDIKLVLGTYENTEGSTGGAISTGLNDVYFFDTEYETTQATTVNLVAESAGSVTITTVADEDGKWEAWGV